METQYNELNSKKSADHVGENGLSMSPLSRVKHASWRNSADLELINEKYEMEKVIRRPSAIPKSPTITSAEFDEYADMFENMPLTEETSCGFWIFRGSLLQKLANKKVYVTLYGLLGCFLSATYAYFNGTITTLEKRYQIPSRTTGIISVGNDISQIFTSLILSYYAGKGHRPRWIAFGTMTAVIFCLMTALPHVMYGPGENSLQLTEEYGQEHDVNETFRVLEKQRKKTLCQLDGVNCEEYSGSFYPQLILFIAQFIGGIGGGLSYTLGISYMDDNIQKSKTPALISFSYFLRMLGPAIGYALASFCLKIYISPTLTPTININDPRWLGAWWLGWIILGIITALLGFLIGLFPKSLPRAAVRRAIALEKRKGQPEEPEVKASFSDMMETFKRLVKNKTYVSNNLSSIFYCLGYMPYWIFMPKYIETQYRQSASVSSFLTGTVGLVFSAVGVLVSGFVISHFKPSARILAAWNVIVGAISVAGMISYYYLGCDASLPVTKNFLPSGELNTSLVCNDACHCDYVSYSPVCSEEGISYISPCHAGCRSSIELNGTKTFTECSCVRPTGLPFDADLRDKTNWGSATRGNCPIDCSSQFYTFLAVVCLLKFVGAAGRSSNFLVGVRCIEERDKTAAMGLSMTILSLFAFVPSPIFFGYILDTTCMVWGKNCAGTGNCWLYDGYQLRYVMNFTAAFLVTIGTLFDGGVWYYVKDLKIFDEDVEVKALGDVLSDD